MKDRNYAASHARAVKNGVKALATLGLYGALFLLAAVHSQIKKSSEREETKKTSPAPVAEKTEEFEPMP
ncbi:MAG: hypothetical protein WC878_05305 [Candidatus Paceibacterota bacterium]|jgi:hypothetical protein